MEIEIRAINQDDFYSALDLDCDSVSYGSEGCHWLLPNTDDLSMMAREADIRSKKFKLVTSKVTEKSFNKILELVEHLDHMGLESEVTINDLGLLTCVKDMKNIEISIGHMFNWSIESCPWHENLIRNENDKIKSIAMDVNNENSFKIDFYKSLGVKGIEADGWVKGYGSLRNICKKGLKVSIHYNRISLSFSRTCPTARYIKTAIPGCINRCSKGIYIKLELDKLWETNERGQHYLDADCEIKSYFDFAIEGNWIYRKSKTDIKEISEFNNIILHSSSAFELEKEIAVIKNRLEEEKSGEV